MAQHDQQAFEVFFTPKLCYQVTDKGLEVRGR
jgi:hypothetical protein